MVELPRSACIMVGETDKCPFPEFVAEAYWDTLVGNEQAGIQRLALVLLNELKKGSASSYSAYIQQVRGWTYLGVDHFAVLPFQTYFQGWHFGWTFSPHIQLESNWFSTPLRRWRDSEHWCIIFQQILDDINNMKRACSICFIRLLSIEYLPLNQWLTEFDNRSYFMQNRCTLFHGFRCSLCSDTEESNHILVALLVCNTSIILIISETPSTWGEMQR